MKTALLYPYVVTKAAEYRSDLLRFVDTFNQFPPGGDFDLFIELCNGDEICGFDQVILSKLKMGYQVGPAYRGEGRDIGGHQFAANWLRNEYEFAAFCSAQVHFHRSGWMERLIDARKLMGESLYGAMGSYEQKRPHIRTCFFACNPFYLREYPNAINSRVRSLQFESQPINFQGFIESLGMTGYLVAWDGVYGPKDYRTPPNVFRKGDQSNCLVWDRHTAIYADADPAQKELTQKLADDTL